MSFFRWQGLELFHYFLISLDDPAPSFARVLKEHLRDAVFGDSLPIFWYFCFSMILEMHRRNLCSRYYKVWSLFFTNSFKGVSTNMITKEFAQIFTCVVCRMCCSPSFLKPAVLFANLHENQIQNSFLVMFCVGIITDIHIHTYMYIYTHTHTYMGISVGPIMWEMKKYYIESRKRGICHKQYKEGMLTVLVTSGVGTVF